MMQITVALFLAVFGCLVVVSWTQDTSGLPSAEGVELVFVGFRHGDRNPGTFLKDDPNKGKWGLEGEAMLTNIGKQQAYGMGQIVRGRYGSLIGDHWFPDNSSKATSSDADRCQQTTQSMLAGIGHQWHGQFGMTNFYGNLFPSLSTSRSCACMM